MKGRLLTGLFAIALLGARTPAVAEDIDLFIGSASDPANPNVLLVIDNAANFSSSAAGSTCIIDGVPTLLSGTVGGIEQCALYQVISERPVDSVNIGIMVYNSSNVVDYQAVPCVQIPAQPGGCLVYPIKPMTADNKAELLAWIKSWKTTGSGAGYIKGNAEATGAVMQEAWAYYFGKTGLSTRSYAGIQPPQDCGRNYIIFVGNSYSSAGTPGDQTGNKGPKWALEGTNATTGMNASPPATSDQKIIINKTITTACPNPNDTVESSATLGTPHETKGYYGDEWTRYLKSRNVTSYTIGLLGAACQESYEASLASMAEVGGGKYFKSTNFSELKLALDTAFSEIQSVNSVFASVSLPVSVNTEGTFLNQVYVGMFRPDGDGLPRWNGNLKQYRLAPVPRGSNSLKLVDAYEPTGPTDNYHSAISSANTGFIAECARSYWTPTADDSYWTGLGIANCPPHPAASNTPDGNVVEKGAQGYILRGLANATSISRTVRACSTAACTALGSFAASNTSITKAALGDALMSDQVRADLIDWAVGLNNKPGDDPYIAATAMRSDVHADVVHSRPIAVNYGTNDAPKIVVVYGGNDGILKAVNGNRSTAFDGPAGSVGAGGELWAFMPTEFYPQIKRLRDNTLKINYKGFPATDPPSQPKPYGIDGPLTVYRGGGNVWLYATMRRGGRAIYAFNITNLASATPAQPTLLWKTGCTTLTDDSGCVNDSTGDFRDLGQTWSSPKVMKTSGYTASGIPQPMLIMGGGYDNCEDADPDTCDSSSKGNGIYVMDAATGQLLKHFDTTRGVVGDVFVITDPATGLAKWAYAADLGGNIYRISGANANTQFFGTDPSNWTITKIASLGCSTVATGCSPANRKFMFAPDIVEDNGIYYLLIGSGDREKPLDDWTVNYQVDNYFFMVQDVPTNANWLTDEQANGNCSDDVICMDSLLEIPANSDPDPNDLAQKKGWFLAMRAHEQVVTAAITVFGTVTFSSHTPTPTDPEACDNDLGTARVYNVSYKNARSTNGTINRSEVIEGGGLPPSPVAGMVTLDDGTTVPFIIGAEPTSPLEGYLPNPSAAINQPKGFTYWFIRK